MNSESLYFSALKSAIQGDLNRALLLRESAEKLKEEEGISFSESASEEFPFLEEALTALLSSYDFTRCMRPNGTFYGTPGKCKKGTVAPYERKDLPKAPFPGSNIPRDFQLNESRDRVKKQKERIKGILAKGDPFGQLKVEKEILKDLEIKRDIQEKARAKEMRDANPNSLYNRKLRKKKELSQQWKVSQEDWEKSIQNRDKAKRALLETESQTKGDNSPESKKKREAASQELNRATKEEEKLRIKMMSISDKIYAVNNPGERKSPAKGVEGGAKRGSTPNKKDLATLDKEWEAERKKTFDSLKGISREQLLNMYRQSSNLDLGSLRDMGVRDLKGAIVSSKHGWYSPSEVRKRTEEKRKSRETK